MRSFVLTAVTASILFICSCSSIEKIQGADKAETYYLRGEAYLKEGMHEQALEKFTLVKNKFPYSKYAVESELKIADTYVAKGDYLESQKLYSVFAEFHPQEPRRDYAIFSSGMSYYKLLPSSVDRDLGYGKNAVQEFRTVMESFPNSVYFKDALERYTEVRTRLATKEVYIGDFYRKRDVCDAAIERFKTVLDEYKDLGFDERMYFEIGKCYLKMDKKDDAKYYLDMLIVQYPNSEYVDKAKKMEMEL
ncbi:MAG: outer membrane protein assembly factor BamD [Pseudomonadota bacterium]